MSEQTAYLLRTGTPKYRYELLLKKYPNIEQQVTQNHIASYLGISRETLSRIRRKKLKCVNRDTITAKYIHKKLPISEGLIRL